MEGNFMLSILVFFPMAGALLAYIIGSRIGSRFSSKNKTVRDYAANSIVVVEFAMMLYMFIMYNSAEGLISQAPTGMENAAGYVTYHVINGFCGMGLHFTIDGFRVLYGLIASFMWMMSTIFSKEYFAHYRNRNRYYFFMLVTLGATMGVFLSADLYTTFIFFEIMSFTSYVWVAHDEKKESLRAAETYLAVAVIGGLVMLMGIFLLYHETGTLDIGALYEVCRDIMTGTGIEYETRQRVLYMAGTCLLFGFGAKAGAFPLHIWLPKAHPAAPAPASALLSGILTKAGIFGILVISCNMFYHDAKWGTLILIIGVVTMALGAVLALFSINLKRTLACSSVSQIGFILVGIGMQGLLGAENTLAVRGSLLHMVNHSLFKLVLFMAAGVIFMNIHKLDLNEIRGFGRKKPLLNFIFLMGALGIGGMPLFNGYISKTLIHESIVEYIEALKMGHLQAQMLGAGAMKGIEWIFLISGGCTVAYMLKLYIAIFIEKNSDGAVQDKFDSLKGKYMNKVSAAALTISALLFPAMGLLPGIVMNAIADLGDDFMHPEEIGEAIKYFSMVNLKGGLVSILIGLFIYFVMIRGWMMKKAENVSCVYVNRWNKYWDLENSVYRPLLLKVLPMIFGVICRILDSLTDSIVVFIRKTVYKDSKLPHELEEGTFLTHVIGMQLDKLIHLLNRTLWKKSPHEEGYEHKLAMKHEEITEDNTIIGRSMSFGLLLFSTGLILTLIYLLWK